MRRSVEAAGRGRTRRRSGSRFQVCGVTVLIDELIDKFCAARAN